MFDVSITNLQREFDEALKFRRLHTDRSQALIRNFAGSRHNTDGEPDTAYHENNEFEVVATILPQICYSDPQFHARLKGGITNDITEAFGVGFNTLLTDIEAGRKLQEIILDSFFDFGVAEAYMEPTPGFDQERDDLDGNDTPTYNRPNFARVSPRHFFVDPLATSIDTARYMGKIAIADKNDLKKVANPDGSFAYDHAMIDRCGVDSWTDEIDKDMDLVRAGVDRKRLSRNDIVYVEIFVPETKMLYCMPVRFCGAVDDASKGFLRPPRPYTGPKGGPWRMFGHYKIPDNVYPLSILAAAAALNEEINAHAGQASRDAAQNKRLHGVDSSVPAVAAQLANAEHDSVIQIPGLMSGAYKAIEFGGAMPETIAYLQVLRERLDRRVGLSETLRGETDGDTTATNDTLAARASEIRIRFLFSLVTQSVKAVAYKLAHFLWFSPTVGFQVVVDNPETGEKEEMMYRGGATPEQAAQFERLDLTLEPYSMEYVSEALLQKRAQDKVQILTGLEPLLRAQGKTLNVMAILDDWGKANNEDNMAERYVMDAPLMPMGVPGAGGQPGPGGTPGEGAGSEADQMAAQLSAAQRT